MEMKRVDRLFLGRAALLCALGGALWLAVASAQVSTSVSVCGSVSAFTAATLTSPGSITIGGQTFAIAANTLIDGSGLIHAGANLCLNGKVNVLGQLIPPSSVTANVTTTVSACGVVSAYTAATAVAPGSITIGGQTLPIAANTSIDGAGLIRAGANLCLSGTVNALGQLVVPSSVTANATTTVSVCGVVSAYTAATATTPGSITIGGQSLPIAANTSIDGSGLIQVGANLCLNGTANVLGQLVPPSSVTANATTTVNVCGVVSAYTAATATAPGSITIGGQTLPIAANTSIDGSGLIQIGANLCLSGRLGVSGELVPPTSVSATATTSVSVCGPVTAFTAATATTPGSITIGGQRFSIAPGTVLGGANQIAIGANLCLDGRLGPNGDLVPPSGILAGGSGGDLTISKSASPEPVSVGQTLTYSIGVTNNGPGDVTGVSVSDPIPAGATLLTALPSQGSCSGSTTVVCAIGTLAAGHSAVITIKVVPGTAGTLVNTATVSGSPADLNPANNTATAVTTVLAGGGGGGGGTGSVSREIIFPVAAHVDGAGQSHWRTDLRIVDFGSSPVTAHIEWYAFSPGGHSGPDKVHDVVVNPGAEGVFDSAIANLLSTSGAGSLRIVVDSTAVGAGLRLYDDQRGTACGGIEGSFEKGLLPSESIPRGALLILSNNPAERDAFRSSLGYFNASAQPSTITFKALTADGRLLATKTVSVPGFANDQKNIFDLIDTVATADRIHQDVYITYEAQGGLPFVYAFAVYNANNDPLLVTPWAF